MYSHFQIEVKNHSDSYNKYDQVIDSFNKKELLCGLLSLEMTKITKNCVL